MTSLDMIGTRVEQKMPPPFVLLQTSAIRVSHNVPCGCDTPAFSHYFGIGVAVEDAIRRRRERITP